MIPPATKKKKSAVVVRDLAAERKKRATSILARLKKEFPGASTALRHENAFQLLIATILSAQCTDERVNRVTPGLFQKYPGPAEFARAIPEELEQEIRSTGFFRMKTRSILGCSKALIERHQGNVPSQMEELVKLPGVGRKTANVVLGQAFGISSGVVVDTHVQRLSKRMGLSEADDAGKIEEDLVQVIKKDDWIAAGSLLILHGRKTCLARTPRCAECVVTDICPSSEVLLRKKR